MSDKFLIHKPGRSVSIDTQCIEPYCVYYARDVHRDPRKQSYDIQKGDGGQFNVPKMRFGFDPSSKIIIFYDTPDDSEKHQNMLLHIRKTDPFKYAGFYFSAGKDEKPKTVASVDISAYHIAWSYISFMLFRSNIGKSYPDFDTKIKVVELPLLGEQCEAYYISSDDELKKYGTTSDDVNNKYGVSVSFSAPCIIVDNKCYNHGDKINALICAYKEYVEEKTDGIDFELRYDNIRDRVFIEELMISMMFYGMSSQEIIPVFSQSSSEDIQKIMNAVEQSYFKEYKDIYCNKYKQIDEKISGMRSLNKTAQYVQTRVVPMIWWNDSVEHNYAFHGRGNPVMEGVKDEMDNFESVEVKHDDKDTSTEYSYPADLTLEELLSRDWDTEEQYYLSMEELIGKNRKAR